ncbi:glycosyltransferase family 4 protein [Halalkalibacter kiskunsagensis]|uniref:Glycosyltransferase family 4 protein n=1 Tax=Halalkalibacter kiskunsagensis TaxID=1548599 RepID=A0ABV6KCN8_9BACI
MKLFINGRFLTQSVTGVQRYSIELIKELDQLIEIGAIKGEFIILSPKNITNGITFKNIKVKKIGLLTGHAWEQIELPLYTMGKLLFNPCGPAPMFKTRQVVTIHDMAVFSNSVAFTKLFVIWYKIIFFFIGKLSKKIFTVSNFSKDELVNYLKIKESKIIVTHLGKEHITELQSDNNILSEYNLTKKKYILAVSSMSPNKNFDAIVKAIDFIKNKNNYDIVIAGGTHPKVFNKKLEVLPSNIKHVGYVSDNELKALYENALCFVFPSYYEGFGLPPLEAMALKCSVIVSDRSSLPEVAGNNALLCNPDNPEDIAMKIVQFKVDSFRESYELKGYNRAQDFSWKKCTEKTINELKDL